MAVDMNLVRKLREQTGIGILECKKAMEAANNDYALAEDTLRKKGYEKAKSKSSRATKEGVIASSLTAEGRTGLLLEMSCETDFVAKNEDFRQMSQDILGILARQATISSPEELLAHDAGEGVTVEKMVAEKIHKIGENLVVRRFVRVNTPEQGLVGTYVHTNGKIGVLVSAECDSAQTASRGEVATLLKDVSMQVAALNPAYLNEKSIPAEAIEREKDIYREQMKNSGKPANIIEKIVEGKMSKFYSESCLSHQAFFKDDSLTIQGLVEKTAKAVGGQIVLTGMIRYQVGEEQN